MSVLLHLSTAIVLALELTIYLCVDRSVPSRIKIHPSAAPGSIAFGSVADKSEYWFHGESTISMTILNKNWKPLNSSLAR